MSSSSSSAVDAAENVQVVVRVRPVGKDDKKRVITASTERKEVVVETSIHHRRFTFDKVFDSDADQASVFNHAVAPVIDQVLEGFSCTVFAYGQTGTGKTYTMEGPKLEDGSLVADGPQSGIIVRAVRRIFAAMERAGCESHVKISFLEIYNERLDDLLAAEPSAFSENGTKGSMGTFKAGAGVSAADAGAADSSSRERLKIVEETVAGPSLPGAASSSTSSAAAAAAPKRSAGAVRVLNLEEIPVRTPEDVFKLVQQGISKRATAETLMNAQSSRSHCVFTLTIHQKETTPEGEDLLRIGKLNLVDLAGSESVGRSGAKDARAREAGNINQSLLTLGRVITALVDHLPHIPYRDSKLTRLLQDSLGGRTRTCIIATLSPTAANVEETMSTLEYANRAKNIKNKPEANARMTKKTLIKEYAGEIETLKARLHAQIAQNGVFLPADQYAEMVERIASLEASVEELESIKLASEEEISGLKDALADMRSELETMTERQRATAAELASTAAELAATAASLAQEQTTHAETRVLVAAHEHTEGALTRQAGVLGSSLQAAAGDVEGLRGKVQRAVGLLTANRAAGEEFVGSAVQRLEALAASSAAFSGAQATGVEALRRSVGSLLDTHAAGAAAAQESLARLRALTAAQARAASQSAVALGEELGSGVAALERHAAAHRTALCAASSDGTAALAAAVDDVRARLDAQAGDLAAWAAASLRTIEEAGAATSEFLAAQANALSELRAAMGSSAAAASCAFAAVGASASQAAAANSAGLAEGAAAVIAGVSALLQTFVAQRDDAARRAMEGVGVAAATAAGAVTAASASELSRLDAVGSAALVWGNRVGSSFTAHRGAVSRSHGITAASVAGIRDCVAAAGTTAAAMQASVAATAGDGATALAADAESMRSTAGAFCSRAKSAAVSNQEAVGKETEPGFQAVGAALAAGKEAAAATAESASGVGAAATAYSASIGAWTVSESNALHGFVGSKLKGDAQSGATPVKRPYDAPVALAATSPHPVILSRVRAAVAAGTATTSPARITAGIFQNGEGAASPAYAPVKPGGALVGNPALDLAAQQQQHAAPPLDPPLAKRARHSSNSATAAEPNAPPNQQSSESLAGGSEQEDGSSAAAAEESHPLELLPHDRPSPTHSLAESCAKKTTTGGASASSMEDVSPGEHDSAAHQMNTETDAEFSSSASSSATVKPVAAIASTSQTRQMQRSAVSKQSVASSSSSAAGKSSLSARFGRTSSTASVPSSTGVENAPSSSLASKTTTSANGPTSASKSRLANSVVRGAPSTSGPQRHVKPAMRDSNVPK